MYKVKRFSHSESKLDLNDRYELKKAKLLPKGYNRALAEAYGDKKDFNKLAKWNAGAAGIGAGTVGAIAGGVLGGKKGAAIGAAIAGLGSAASSYAGTKLGGSINKKLRKSNETFDKAASKAADIYSVGAGDMAKDDFVKKYGK